VRRKSPISTVRRRLPVCVAMGYTEGTAEVWDATSGLELLALCGHDAPVTTMAWSPDGKRLATASEDQTVKVWNAANEQEVLTVRAHNSFVSAAAWSPDGKAASNVKW
jgi:WD40 repeat protein